MHSLADRPIRIVVDSSVLRSAELRALLAEHRANLAVVTEVTAFEPYRNVHPETIARNLAILCEFPGQVVVLRGVGELVALEKAGPVSADEFVHQSQTLGQREFCAGLELARSGHPELRRQLEAHVAAAQEHHRGASVGATQVGEAIRRLVASFGRDNVSALRRGDRYPPEVVARIWALVRGLAADLFEHSYPGERIDVESYPGSQRLLFRMAAVAAMEALWWARHGGIEGQTPERLANSLFDSYQIAIATKCDLLLTNDSKMREIYAETGAFLEVVYGKLGPEPS